MNNPKNWHSLSINTIVEKLETNLLEGLGDKASSERLQRFGLNQLTEKNQKSPFLLFLIQFHNPLIYILLAASLATFFLKDLKDALVIFVVVLINAFIGFFQEYRAEKATAALANTVSSEATVLRNAQIIRLQAKELAPGDIVFLQAGDKVPADLRLFESRDLQIAESALTGESVLVEKSSSSELTVETPLADRKNMAYASTLVTMGSAKGVVIGTGDNTEIGNISTLINETEKLETPLTKKIKGFSQTLLFVILGLAVLTFAVSYLFHKQNLLDSLLSSIALAVGMIPEGLPAALTITLAIGVNRMAKRNAIIRKLPAVETLGSTSVICSDKTGTLTQNQMTVEKVWTDEAVFEFTAEGYKPEGEIKLNGVVINASQHIALIECLKAGLLCNDSQLVFKENNWSAQGDPTEVALIVSAKKAGLEGEVQYKRLDSLPFDSAKQFMGTLNKFEDSSILYLKGSLESIIEKCSQALNKDGQQVDFKLEIVHQAVQQMAQEGMRVLAFAKKKLSVSQTKINESDLSGDFVFLGLQAMIDPPRLEAAEAIKTCHTAGIKVKMITGDHATTALAIAQSLKIADENSKVYNGVQLAELDDNKLREVATECNVFARVAPEQKLRLVQALQSRGEVIAMTGDGVNDAPALKQADIGIAMGITGTDVSKEAADMILTDDNFATIEAAVEEGRVVFDNLIKLITWMLPTNLGIGLIILISSIFGIALPLLPIQILWINMTSAGVIGLCLAFEDKEPKLMSRSPRNPKEPLISKSLVSRIVFVASLIVLISFGLFKWTLLNGSPVAYARSESVNLLMVFMMFYIFNCRSLTQNFFQVPFFSNPWVLWAVAATLVIQSIFTYVPFMNKVFGSVPLSPDSWFLIFGLGAISSLIIEFEKFISNKFKAKPVS